MLHPGSDHSMGALLMLRFDAGAGNSSMGRGRAACLLAFKACTRATHAAGAGGTCPAHLLHPQTLPWG